VARSSCTGWEPRSCAPVWARRSEPVDGPAKGIPYIAFAGNVGDDESLAQVTRKLSSTV
jgi:hypothetical protein